MDTAEWVLLGFVIAATAIMLIAMIAAPGIREAQISECMRLFEFTREQCVYLQTLR